MTARATAQPVRRDQPSEGRSPTGPPRPFPPLPAGEPAGTAHRYQAPVVREHPRRWDPIAGREVFDQARNSG